MKSIIKYLSSIILPKKYDHYSPEQQVLYYSSLIVQSQIKTCFYFYLNFTVNNKNALRAISKVNFSDEERFNEFIGGLSSEAKTEICIDAIKNEKGINFVSIFGMVRAEYRR